MTRGPAVHTPAAERRRVEVDGIVQGVGFKLLELQALRTK